jgi:hypothetical protein
LPTTSYAVAGTLVADQKPNPRPVTRHSRGPRGYDVFKSLRMSAASTK